MDKKDQIILQQLDVIRSMTENNVRRMGSDFWGTPFESVGKTPAAPAGKDAEKNTPPSPATASPTRTRSCRLRRRSRICWRSWTATSA